MGGWLEGEWNTHTQSHTHKSDAMRTYGNDGS